jgi:hypothetical protein
MPDDFVGKTCTYVLDSVTSSDVPCPGDFIIFDKTVDAPGDSFILTITFDTPFPYTYIGFASDDIHGVPTMDVKPFIDIYNQGSATLVERLIAGMGPNEGNRVLLVPDTWQWPEEGKPIWNYYDDVIRVDCLPVFDGSGNWQCAAVGYILNGSEHQGDWVEGYDKDDGSQSKQPTHLYLQASDHNDTAERTWVTDGTISLKCIQSIVIDWENTGVDKSDNESYLIVSTSKTSGHWLSNAQLMKTESFVRTSDTLDVSGLTGSYYIRVHARDDDNNDPDTSTLMVYSIELQ